MFWFRIGRYLALAGLMCFLEAAAFGQAVNNAQIHGSVQDPSGAAVVGAKITAVNASTGVAQSTVSGADGSFVLPDIPVGDYRIEATASGFSKYVQTGIVLQVGQNVLLRIPLAVGDVTQQVQVSANASMVETQDTSISEVIDQQRIVDLPLNGRQATDLIMLSGGAAMPPNAASRVVTTHDYVNSIGVSVSGGQINGNNYLLDGGDNNDAHSNINMPFPFPDALQEYSIQTNGISARYGLHPGAVINVVTKSGGNSYHGDLFYFVRTPDLNAQNRFSTAASKDELHRNQFGGTLGGPIRKNKLFAFGGYQKTIIHNVSGSNTVYVPTQAMLNGNWTACPGKTLILNPATYTAASLAYVKLMPTSTDPCGKLTYPASNPSDEYQVIGRTDWDRTPKNTLFARYFILDYANPAVYTNNILTLSRPSLLDRSQSIVLGNQITISPTIINEMHFTYTRLAIHRSNPEKGLPSPASLGVQMYNSVPNFAYIQVSNYFTIGGGSNAPAKFIRNQYQWSDDTDWVKGRHHFSFGAENIIGQMYQSNVYDANGFFNFNGQGTGDSLGDFLEGDVYQMTNTGQQISNSWAKYIGAYFEDDIQLTKTFNVHGGVRWEPSLPETQQYNEGNHFDQAAFAAGTKSTVFTNAPPGVFFYGDKGIPKGYAKGSYDDFAPRIGIAWAPGQGKESIRSSYGIFFDEPEAFTNSAFSLAPPWANGLTLTTPPGGFMNPYQGIQGGDPFPNTFPPTKDAQFNLSGTYINLPLNLHHPYMEQWDLSFERQFGSNWSVTASYIGNKGTHMRSGYEANAPVYIPGNSTTKNEPQRRVLYLINPAAGAYFSTLTTMNDGVNTNYNAVQLSARHRLSHGYTLLLNYTYSHCNQDTETVGNKLQGNTQTDPNNMRFDYGPCDFDLRHNLNGSFIYEGYKFSDPTVNMIFGGISPAVLAYFNNGYSFSPLTGTDASLTGIGLDRPNSVPGVNPYVRNTKTMEWINPNAFATNGPGSFGNTGMNSLLGPHYTDVDLSLRKLFKTYREQTLELRFEAFNIFNHPNLSAPVNSLKSSAFGMIQSADPPRILQLAGKYVF